LFEYRATRSRFGLRAFGGIAEANEGRSAMTTKAHSIQSRRRVLRAGAGAAAGLALGLPRIRRAGAADVELTMWQMIFPVTDPNDKSKKPEDFWIHQAIKRFEEANPGTSVKLEDPPGAPETFTKYRTASIAKNGPDIFATWSGHYMLDMKQYLEPLDPYVTTEDRARIFGWEAATEGFKPGEGTTYGIPAGTDGVVCFFTNKELLQKAGVDPEAPLPPTFDEFTALLDQIKASGTTPLVLSNQSFVYHTLNYWTAQVVNGAPGLQELIDGKRNFSDPTTLEVARKWATLSNKDWTIPGTPTMEESQAAQLLFAGKAAMITSGAWFIRDARVALGDKLGMVKIPDFNADVTIKDAGVGGPGTVYVVSNYSEKKDAAIALIKHLVSKEEQEKRATANEGALINVNDVDYTTLYNEPLRLQQQQWVSDPAHVIFWPDNVYPFELITEIIQRAQTAWTGDSSPEEFMKQLDQKRDELLGKS
jgi:raffinose/stachyose/melibiose transport system substrate-binding protein